MLLTTDMALSAKSIGIFIFLRVSRLSHQCLGLLSKLAKQGCIAQERSEATFVSSYLNQFQVIDPRNSPAA